MKKFMANFLFIAVFVGLVGYIGYNVKKANPDFGKDVIIKLPKSVTEKLEESKRQEIEKNTSFEKIDYSNTNEVNVELGKKTVRNMIKYLKHIEVYEEEFYDIVPFIRDRNVEIIKVYNELYNKDLVNNEIAGDIEVIVDIEADESMKYMAGLYNYKAIVPLSNNTTKEIEGKINLDENNKWLCDITGKKFDKALDGFYGENTKVTADTQRIVLKMFRTELTTLVEMIQDGESYKDIEKLLDKERGSLNQTRHDELVKLLKGTNFRIVSLKVEPNQNVYKKEINHISGKKAYRYTIYVEMDTTINNESVYYKDNLGVYEVDGEISISDSYLVDFIQNYK